MSDRQETYIYESPDGGHTVYRRLVGESPTEREIHSISEQKKQWDLREKREHLWYDIVRASEQDPVLYEMLDQIEVYYRLKSQP